MNSFFIRRDKYVRYAVQHLNRTAIVIGTDATNGIWRWQAIFTLYAAGLVLRYIFTIPSPFRRTASFVNVVSRSTEPAVWFGLTVLSNKHNRRLMCIETAFLLLRY